MRTILWVALTLVLALSILSIHFFRNSSKALLLQAPMRPHGLHCNVSDTRTHNYIGYEDASINRAKWSFNLVQEVHQFMFRTEKDVNARLSHPAFDLVGPIGPKCKQMEKFGEGDLEKRSCGLKEKAKTEACIIISIGSHNEWNFEESIFNETSCITHTFDCTLPCQVPVAISSRTFFHDICIGPENKVVDGKKFMNWDSLMDKIDLHHPPTYLKMDIEGWEFHVLSDVLSSTTHLPEQIAVEVHIIAPVSPPNRSPGEIAMFMDFLYRVGGYFVVDRHDNPYCSSCTELLLQRFCR